MKILLTVLSMLTSWTLLGVVFAGLLAILKPLERVRRSLEQITMGVRAIERETAPLGTYVNAAIGTLTETAAVASSLADKLGEADRDLESAVAALGPRT